jgi:threonine dehydrogenase-like Zn-dependent dehydrogenase
MSSQQPSLPKTHRALVVTSRDEPPTIKDLPTPQPVPGSAIVRIICANIVSYMRDIYNGKRQHAYPTPLVAGTSAIGRLAAVGPDATLLSPGQLVIIDSTIRGRDDAGAVSLLGIHEGFTPGSARLMRGEWRDATYAEYAKVPLENCHVLDEKRLLGAADAGGLGYAVEDLAMISRLMVPYGGLRDIGLRAGETVIVAPATGQFGGAAVAVALAMGARVIAMGRNVEVLKKVASMSDRIETVPITGDENADMVALRKFGVIDAFFDISPPGAAGTTHIKSAILALRPGGRVSLMGGIRGDVAIPYGAVMHRDLKLKGKWMYPRDAVGELIKMVEIGLLKVGKPAGFKVVGKFSLEEWDEAFTATEKNAGIGEQALICP